MTKVYISHNPFNVTTEFMINDEVVAATSTLYRYRNTPMNDWVTVFLHDLIEHCNDDELQITFKGLQFNFDDLENEVNMFLSKNRDYDIGLEHEASKSQIARLGAINSIIDEIKTQHIISEIKSDVFLNTLSGGTEPFHLYVLSGNDELKYNFLSDFIEKDLNKLGSDKAIEITDNDKQMEISLVNSTNVCDYYETNIAFVASKFAKLVIHDVGNTENQSNEFYRMTKKAIADESKPIIIVLIDQDNTCNSPEFLNLIEGQYSLRGRKNKNRFLFVSNTPTQSKKMLYSDYGIQNAIVYSPDEMKKIRASVIEYMEETFLVHRIAEKSALLTSCVRSKYDEVEQVATKQKNIDGLDALIKDTIQLAKQISYHFSLTLSEGDQMKQVNLIISEIEQAFTDSCFKESNKSGYRDDYNGDRVKESITDFCGNQLPTFIQEKLNDLQNILQNSCRKRVNINESLIQNLQKIDCTTCISDISKIRATLNDMPIPHFQIKEIEDIKFQRKYDAADIIFDIPAKVKGGCFVSDLPNGGKLYEYNFFDGLERPLFGSVYYGSYIDQSNVEILKERFHEQIVKIVPIVDRQVQSYISECSQTKKEHDKFLKKAIDNIISDVTKQAEVLKAKAKISVKNEQKLNYLNSLLEKSNTLIAL